MRMPLRISSLTMAMLCKTLGLARNVAMQGLPRLALIGVFNAFWGCSEWH